MTTALILLVDEAWIYTLSGLNAESKLLQKHTDKVFLLHYTTLDKLVGRCFVNELLSVKAKAEAKAKAAENNEPWTAFVEPKYLKILESLDFKIWYAKNLEYLITQSSGSELKGDGLVIYQREQDGHVVQNASVKERKERQDLILRHLLSLKENLMTHVIQPNIAHFDCLIKKFGCPTSTKKVAFELDTFSAIVGGDRYIQVVKPPVVVVNIIEQQQEEDKLPNCYTHTQISSKSEWFISYEGKLNNEDVGITRVLDFEGNDITDYIRPHWNRAAQSVVVEFLAGAFISSNHTGSVKFCTAKVIDCSNTVRASILLNYDTDLAQLELLEGIVHQGKYKWWINDDLQSETSDRLNIASAKNGDIIKCEVWEFGKKVVRVFERVVRIEVIESVEFDEVDQVVLDDDYFIVE